MNTINQINQTNKNNVLGIKERFVNKKCTLNGQPAVITGWHLDTAYVMYEKCDGYRSFSWEKVEAVMTSNKNFQTIGLQVA